MSQNINLSRMQQLRQRRMSRLPLSCSHPTMYLGAHPTCQGLTQICKEKCMAGHTGQKHEIIDKDDFLLEFKVQKDRKGQMITGYIENLKIIYEQHQAYLLSVYMGIEKQMKALSFNDQQIRLMEYVHNNKFGVLECNHIYLLQHSNINKKQVIRKAQQMVQNFKNVFNQGGKSNQELHTNKINQVLIAVKNQFKQKVDEQRKSYIQRHLQLEQTCKKLQEDLKQMKRKYEKQLEFRKKVAASILAPKPATQNNFSTSVQRKQQKQQELIKKTQHQQNKSDSRFKQAQNKQKSPEKMIDQSESKKSNLKISESIPKMTPPSTATTTNTTATNSFPIVSLSTKPSTTISSNNNNKSASINTTNNTTTNGSNSNSKTNTEKPKTQIDKALLEKISQNIRSKTENKQQSGGQSSTPFESIKSNQNKTQNSTTQAKDPNIKIPSQNDSSVKPPTSTFTYASTFTPKPATTPTSAPTSTSTSTSAPTAPSSSASTFNFAPASSYLSDASKLNLKFTPASQKLSPISKNFTSEIKSPQTPSFPSNVNIEKPTQPTIKEQDDHNRKRISQKMDDFGLEDPEIVQSGFRHPKEPESQFTPYFTSNVQSENNTFYYKNHQNKPSN